MKNNADYNFINQHKISNMRGTAYGIWLKLGLANYLKKRRFQFINKAFDGGLLKSDGRILEIGCGSGKDFINFLPDNLIKIHGVDLFDTRISKPNFNFHLADAENLPFDDKNFDYTVSIGVLEHIEPISKLELVTQEIQRVSRNFCIIVPAINSVVEPHFWQPFWQLRLHKNNPGTNYFSDHTWRNFSGFKECRLVRHSYLPGLIQNLYIIGRS